MSEHVPTAAEGSGSDLIADLVRRTQMVSDASTQAVAGLDRSGEGTSDPLTQTIVEQLHSVHDECARIHGILERVAGMMATETAEPALVAVPAQTPAAEAAATPAFQAEPTPAFQADPTPAFQADPPPAFQAEPTPAPEAPTIPAADLTPEVAPTVQAPTPVVEAPAAAPDFAGAMPPPTGAPVDPSAAVQPAVEPTPGDAIGPPPGQGESAVSSDLFASSGSATSYPGTGTQSSGEPSDGVRLLATQMAVAGESAGDIERRLRVDFGVPNADAIVRELFGPS